MIYLAKFTNANDLFISAFFFGAKFCTNARERKRENFSITR